jgi:ParB-like chromosome segregation protein Spo0J
MLLSLIFANHEKYQKRDTKVSPKTVAAIVKEGIILSKFAPIPIFAVGKKWCVAGDGHSRYEAILQLLNAGKKLPKAWARGKDWDIPHLEVTQKDAELLALTANLSRDNFTPAEEAKVFQEMLDRGMPIEEVARHAHKGVGYVQNLLPLNFLIREIKDAIGRSPDSGGIDKHIASVMGAAFKKHVIEAQQQQEIWQKVFCKADLTANFVRKFLERIAPAMQAKQSQGELFEIPPSAMEVVEKMNKRSQNLRRFQRGLAWLLQAIQDSDDVLDDLDQEPAVIELRNFLEGAGERALQAIVNATESDAGLLSNVVLAEK